VVIRLGQIGVRFPLVADVVDALEEIFDVNRILIIFCGIEGRVLGVSCEVTCFGVFHAALDDAWVLCVNVVAVSWFYFVLGDDDGWHFCGEATFVLAFGDRCVLVPSDKHIGTVEVATQRASVCLSLKRLQVLLAVITLLAFSAVLHSLSSLHQLRRLTGIDGSLFPEGDSLSRQNHYITTQLLLPSPSIHLFIICCVLQRLRISHHSLPLDISILLILGRRLRYQA
jgi:hypothetical protein